jgi:hypothetical protein
MRHALLTVLILVPISVENIDDKKPRKKKTAAKATK